jgi:hypothetical protein
MLAESFQSPPLGDLLVVNFGRLGLKRRNGVIDPDVKSFCQRGPLGGGMGVGYTPGPDPGPPLTGAVSDRVENIAR